MIRVGYHSPLVPPEWIAAHGLAPQWLWLAGSTGAGGPPARRGQCPFAAAVAATVGNGDALDALVLTTTCDQMRSAAALLEQEGAGAVFLMHVPATWQTPSARVLYRDELLRLGRFLERLGGQPPSPTALWETMQAYEAARRDLVARRASLTASRFAAELAAVRSALWIEEQSKALLGDKLPNPRKTDWKSVPKNVDGFPIRPTAKSVAYCPAASKEPAGWLGHCERSEHAPVASRCEAIPLALVGGPITAGDAEWFAVIEAAGGRIALDASEGGERTLPAPFDANMAEADPLAALVEGYFGAIVDIGRRPVAPLHDWLVREIGRRAIRGVIFRRYVSCDLWLGELHPLRQRLGVPVLDLDATHVAPTTDARTVARIDAFLETLR